MVNKVFLMTGLSGSGKTTIANAASEYDHDFIVVDGDAIRKGLCSDLGYDVDSRIENIRRISFVSKFLLDSGLTPIVPIMCPTDDMRKIVKDIIGYDFVKLIYIKCSIDTCIFRDVKGLYKKYSEGKLSGMYGLDLEFDDPSNYSDLIIDTDKLNIKESVNGVVDFIFQY